MSAVEDGALGGLIVALVPGIRIKLGKPTLNKRQKRPLFGFLFSWSATILGFVIWPIIWLSLGYPHPSGNREIVNQWVLLFIGAFVYRCLWAWSAGCHPSKPLLRLLPRTA